MNRPIELDDKPINVNGKFVKEVYDNVFSDNRNITILILALLLLLTFSRIEFVQWIATFLLNLISFLYRFISDVLYTLINSIGEILNGTSNTITSVSKTSLDLGNGALNDVGNLMTDTQCQYKGNPVVPNQCKQPKSVPQKPKAIVTPSHIVTPTKRLIKKTSTPRVTGKFIPTKTSKPTMIRTSKPSLTTVPVLVTTTPVPPTTIPSKTIPSTTIPLTTIPVTTQPFYSMSMNDPMDYSGSSDTYSGNILPNKNVVRKFDLDHVLEGMATRSAVEFEPDPIESSYELRNKPAWCRLGEFNNKKTCVEINTVNQSCMSGLLFKDQDECAR